MTFSLLPTPPLTVAQHIALDRNLLPLVGSGDLPPLLRFWDCLDEAVVLGVAQKVDDHVHADACAADSVPVLKRFSGGGTVWIGRGCLVFSVIRPFGDDIRQYDVQGAYRTVFQPVLDQFSLRGLAVTFEPPCDLALDGMKICGNAQAQRRGAVRIHGSFLINEDISRIARYVKHPTIAPTYRQGRPHSDFICNLSTRGFTRATLAALLQAAWSAGHPISTDLTPLLDQSRAEAQGRGERPGVSVQ